VYGQHPEIQAVLAHDDQVLRIDAIGSRMCGMSAAAEEDGEMGWRWSSWVKTAIISSCYVCME
jgi:hypothetical protein